MKQVVWYDGRCLSGPLKLRIAYQAIRGDTNSVLFSVYDVDKMIYVADERVEWENLDSRVMEVVNEYMGAD